MSDKIKNILEEVIFILEKVKNKRTKIFLKKLKQAKNKI